jgi:hypothetical protein
MERLNFILEQANGSTSVLTFALLVFLTFYLCDWLHYKKMNFLAAFFVGLPPAIALASILYLEKVGTLMTRLVALVWRMTGGGKTPFTLVQTYFLLAGAIVTAIGLLLMIRLLTMPRFGNWPWLVSAGLAGVFLVVNSVIHAMA